MLRKKYMTVTALGALVTCGSAQPLPPAALVAAQCKMDLPKVEPLNNSQGPHVGPFLLEEGDKGDVSVLSMNVQRLPYDANPEYRDDRIACLSKLSAAFDLVAYQENFMGWARSEDIKQRLYTQFNSGLSVNGKISFTKIAEKKYSGCNGWFGAKNDCLAEKGYQEINIRGIPFFNTHLDAGDALEDSVARESQLAEIVQALPAEGPVVVVGDFNLKRHRAGDEANYKIFLRESGLQEIARSAEGLDVILGRGVKAKAIGTVGNALLSDHKGLVARLEISQP